MPENERGGFFGCGGFSWFWIIIIILVIILIFPGIFCRDEEGYYKE